MGNCCIQNEGICLSSFEILAQLKLNNNNNNNSNINNNNNNPGGIEILGWCPAVDSSVSWPGWHL